MSMKGYMPVWQRCKEGPEHLELSKDPVPVGVIQLFVSGVKLDTGVELEQGSGVA
jgi:hypothetical protein